MLKTNSSMAQQIAEAALRFEARQTGHVPESATVVLSEDTLVVTLHGALSPTEKALAQTPAGAARVQEFHHQFFTSSEVLVSPLQRARRTCELAGFAALARVTPDLVEWDYGDYEGRLTPDIQRDRPGWYLFCDGCPGGESLAEVNARADRVIAPLRADGSRVLVFGHGHFTRVLAARRMGLTPEDARHLMLSTASLSIVGYEHNRDDPAILLWNDDHHVHPGA